MNSVPLMDADAQRLYINSMLSNPELFARVNNIVQPSYFDDDLAKGVKFMQEYFQEYRGVPATSVYTAATKLPTEIVHLPRQDIEYVANQLAEFCKFQACIDVVRKAMGKDGYFEKGDLGSMVAKMKQATEIGLLTDLGIDYFNNPLERIERVELTDKVIPTGWKTVDDVIGGGIGRGELVDFLAPSGGGKSVGMLNLGRNLLAQGLHGVYISLEMGGNRVAGRSDQIIARMSSGMVNMNKAQVAEEITKFSEKSGARFWIKRMREGTTNANDILSYLRQLESTHAFRPDFVIVDYLDIMASVQKGHGDSMFLKDKYVSEEVRAIGFDYDCMMISASQLGKHATEAINDGKKMHQGDVQGGSSKTNTADLMIAISRTEAMMAAGEVRFDFPKSRNSGAVSKQVTLAWDPDTLEIYDLGSRLQLKKKPGLDFKSPPPGTKKLDLGDLQSKFS